MSGRRARRFRWNGRLAGLLLLATLVLAVGLTLFLLRPWSNRSTAALEPRLEAGVATLADYRERIEASLHLQFLEAALVDGRRSNELRADYRLLEEELEPVIARMEPEERAALESELRGLLPDLSRDRSAARRRLVEMEELLLPPLGLERQGDVQ